MLHNLIFYHLLFYNRARCSVSRQSICWSAAEMGIFLACPFVNVEPSLFLLLVLRLHHAINKPAGRTTSFQMKRWISHVKFHFFVRSATLPDSTLPHNCNKQALMKNVLPITSESKSETEQLLLSVSPSVSTSGNKSIGANWISLHLVAFS